MLPARTPSRRTQGWHPLSERICFCPSLPVLRPRALLYSRLVRMPETIPTDPRLIYITSAKSITLVALSAPARGDSGRPKTCGATWFRRDSHILTALPFLLRVLKSCSCAPAGGLKDAYSSEHETRV